MEKLSPKSSSAKISIVGLFAVLSFVLTLPIVVLLSQERQELRGKASESTPTPKANILNDGKPSSMNQSSGAISGYVYYDTNKNGEREPEEKPYPGAKIKITQITEQAQNQTKSQEVSILTTDMSGYFKFHFSNIPDSVAYMVKLILPDEYKTINTNPSIVSDLQKDTRETIEFGLFAIPNLSTMPTITLNPTPTVKKIPTTAPSSL